VVAFESVVYVIVVVPEVVVVVTLKVDAKVNVVVGFGVSWALTVVVDVDAKQITTAKKMMRGRTNFNDLFLYILECLTLGTTARIRINRYSSSSIICYFYARNILSGK
jgi:hypothetical protein